MSLRPAVQLILSAVVAIAAIDPTGLYTINFMTQGSPMTLTLRIDKKDSGGYGGQMTGENLPPLPITSIKVSGNSVKITFTAPDNTEGTINFVLASDNTISGEWMMTGDGSKISGKKTS